MENMRRMLPAPSLRMSEGGMFDSLKRAVGMGPPETIQQKFAREDAALKAKMAASAPPAPAPAPPPKAVSGYVGNSALEGRMKAAGLRNGGDLRTGMGGHVPGKGSGDKIPAKYEPGEFVVSNDMLDAAPELREQLSSLRGRVLAEKGMTPEQADAKALRGTGLRAQGGFDPFGRMAKDLTGQKSLPPRSPMGATAESLGRGPMGAPPPPVDSEAVKLNQAARAAAANRGAANAAETAQRAPTYAADAAKAVKAAPATVNQGPAYKQMFDAGAKASKVARSFGGPLVPGVAAAGSLADDAGRVAGVLTDGNATGIDKTAAVSGSLGKAAATGLGAAAGAKYGALAGGLIGSVFPGPGTVVGSGLGGLAGSAIGGYLGNRAASSVMGQDDEAPASAAPTLRDQAPSPMTGAGSDAKRRSGDFGYTPVGPTGRPYSPDFSRELATGELPQGLRRNVIHKTLDANGRTVYSGMNGGSGGIVDKNGQTVRSGFGVTSLPGMPQAEIDATLTNPDGSRWSSQDNAIMAANLRDGVDPYRGTSRGQQGGGEAASVPAMSPLRARLEELSRQPGKMYINQAKMLTQLRNDDMGHAASMAQIGEQAKTLRRGQDMDSARSQMETESRERVARAPAELAAQQRQMRAQVFKMAGGDPRKAAQIMMQNGMDPEDALKIVDTLQTQSKASDEAATKDLEAGAVTKNKDGIGVIDQGKLAVGRNVAQNMAPGFFDMDAQQRAAALPDVQAGMNIVNGANSLRENSWAKRSGLDKTTERTTLPDLTGASVGDVGFWDGAWRPNVGRGDVRITTRDGQVLYVPKEEVGENEKALLKKYGAKKEN